MKKERKHYTPEEKVSILRRHLVEKVPVSELCEKFGLQPTVFYRWLKEFFENGAAAFQHQSDPESKRDKQRIAALEEKLKSKNEVLAELMEEHVALKKVLASFKGHLDASRYAGCRGGLHEWLVAQDGDCRKAVYSLAGRFAR